MEQKNIPLSELYRRASDPQWGATPYKNVDNTYK